MNGLGRTALVVGLMLVAVGAVAADGRYLFWQEEAETADVVVRRLHDAKDCKHWGNADDPDPDGDLEREEAAKFAKRPCDAITTCSPNTNARASLNVDYGYGIYLETAPDFGCVLFEGRTT